MKLALFKKVKHLPFVSFLRACVWCCSMHIHRPIPWVLFPLQPVHLFVTLCMRVLGLKTFHKDGAILTLWSGKQRHSEADEPIGWEQYQPLGLILISCSILWATLMVVSELSSSAVQFHTCAMKPSWRHPVHPVQASGALCQTKSSLGPVSWTPIRGWSVSDGAYLINFHPNKI